MFNPNINKLQIQTHFSILPVVKIDNVKSPPPHMPKLMKGESCKISLKENCIQMIPLRNRSDESKIEKQILKTSGRLKRNKKSIKVNVPITIEAN